MTQQQIDLIKKEHDQCLEVGMLNQFLWMEPAQTNSQFPLSKLTQDLERGLDQNFSHDKNVIREKVIAKKYINNNTERKVYSLTKVKAWNFLTIISYSHVKEADLHNSSFVLNCCTFLVLYLNPFYLEQKFQDAFNREKFETLWSCFLSSDFYYSFVEVKISQS